MIGRIRGSLIEKLPGRVVVDVGGVGYDVHIPLSTFYELPEDGGQIDLLIHTHVREDALQLYGFGSALEKNLFEKLITVSGIGPKLAITILSGSAPEELVGALSDGRLERLTRIPGVGRKTAERLILELRDKMIALQVGAVRAAARRAAGDTVRDDLVSALVNLGYRKSDAEASADQALAEEPEGDRRLENALRRTLRSLSR
jgi:Holliday junction DNA helicase RuvA